jgi:hypothetical protein
MAEERMAGQRIVEAHSTVDQRLLGTLCHAFPLSAKPLGLGRNSLSTPTLATMDFRVLKYFPFGGVRRLDVVAEFFNVFNSANVSQINPVFGSGLIPIAGFGQPIAGTGARQIQFSLDFEF